MKISQPNGEEATVCSERCPLAISDNIYAARRWAMGPLEPQSLSGQENDTESVGLTDKDRAVRCLSRVINGRCGLTIEEIQ